MLFSFFDGGKYAGLFIAVFLVIFSTMGAEKLSNEEKIRIIGEIADEAVKDKKTVVWDDVYGKVAKHMSLNPVETEETLGMLDRWTEDAKKEYSVTKAKLTETLSREAEGTYPVVKPGTKVDIQCSHEGIQYRVTGKFFRTTKNHVVIGTRTIPRDDIPDVERFDPGQTEKLRRAYVNRKLSGQLGSMDQFVKKYVGRKKKKNRTYQLLLGKIPYDGLYFSAKNLTSHLIKKKQAEQDAKLNEKLDEICASTRDFDVRIERLGQLLKENEGTRFESVIRKRITKEEDAKLNKKLEKICASTRDFDVRIERLGQLLKENEGTRFESVIRTRLAAEKDKREAERRRIAEKRRRAEEERQKRKQDMCPVCGGEGYLTKRFVQGTPRVPCYLCNGSGSGTSSPAPGDMCHVCSGTGYYRVNVNGAVYNQRCSQCVGTGYIPLYRGNAL